MENKAQRTDRDQKKTTTTYLWVHASVTTSLYEMLIYYPRNCYVYMAFRLTDGIMEL